jgi:hypothetical protein
VIEVDPELFAVVKYETFPVRSTLKAAEGLTLALGLIDCDMLALGDCDLLADELGLKLHDTEELGLLL